MNKKIATIALVGILALGGTFSAYAVTAHAATNDKVSPSAVTTTQTVDQEKDQAKDNEQGKENDEKDLTAANTKTAITEGQAKDTALASIKDGVFQSIELEDENGVIVYGVQVQAGTNSYDIKVDANTGKILKSDQDNDKMENGKDEKGSNTGDKDTIEHENSNDDPAGYED